MEQKDYDTAEELINDTVDGSGGSPDGMLHAIEDKSEALEAAEKAKVQEYVGSVRKSIQGMIVNDLDDGIGGVYTGDRIEIATDTLFVGASMDETLDRIDETSRHEKYHRQRDHLAPMKLGASAEDENVVTIGGEAFTDTAIVEGLTVKETGNEFVSDQYVEYQRTLTSALARAALDWDDVRQAVNIQKDYGILDDESRGVTERSPALSA